MSPPTPYWQDPDNGLQLYHGDMREILPALGVQADLILADPPYAETSLEWDRWPTGWPTLAAESSSSMWCFGSMRMFLDRAHEFTDWKLSQDVVWEKHNGTSFAADRFKRVHEHVLHWYRGPWETQHQDVPRVAYHGPDQHARARYDNRAEHAGAIKAVTYRDDGTRLMRSVIKVKSVRGGIHKTEKPLPLLLPLIQYACPPGGLIVDPMAGSCVVLEAARLMGLRAVAIEARESQCEAAARRLSALTLPVV